MGCEEDKSQENTLVDFLYKDMYLINSFYSQMFNGTLNSVVKTELSSDISNDEANLGIGIIGAKLSSSEKVDQTISSKIDPMDAVILKLIEALGINITEESLENVEEGHVVGIKGKLMFRDYKVINDLMPIFSETNIVPQFSQPIDANAKGKNKKFTIGKLIQKLISILPFGLEFELITQHDEHIISIIKEEYLTIKPNDLIRTYGLTLPGEWTVIGILDSTASLQCNSKSEFKNGVDEITKVYYDTMNEGACNYVIRPITIYRKIQK